MGRYLFLLILMAGKVVKAEVVYDEPECKTLRGEYEDCPQGSGDNSAVIEYSIFLTAR